MKPLTQFEEAEKRLARVEAALREAREALAVVKTEVALADLREQRHLSSVERKVWTTEEVAESIGCARSAAAALIAKGVIPSVLIGTGLRRVLPEDLDKYLHQLRGRPGSDVA